MNNVIYKVVSDKSQSELESKVQNLLDNGYRTLGGISVSDGIIYQSLLKEDPDLDKIKALVKAGSKLEAVKLYMELKNVDLKTAKAFVDSL